MRDYQEYLRRQVKVYGTQFDASDLAQHFVPYYESGARIRVQTLGVEVTGWVSVTTGWRPCFLLMRTTHSIGSCYLIHDRDTVLAVKRGRRYEQVD